MINFHTLIAKTGSKDGARASFEEMLAQLIRLSQPVVRRVEANPGDWGIDVFVGQLDGLISVWQSKFFIDGVGEAQQQQIRESLASLMASARVQGFSVNTWTLCIPCSMDAQATKWWEGWKKRNQSKYGITIDLWDETELRNRLLRPDAGPLRDTYFGLGPPPLVSLTPRSLGEACAEVTGGCSREIIAGQRLIVRRKFRRELDDFLGFSTRYGFIIGPSGVGKSAALAVEAGRLLGEGWAVLLLPTLPGNMFSFEYAAELLSRHLQGGSVTFRWHQVVQPLAQSSADPSPKFAIFIDAIDEADPDHISRQLSLLHQSIVDVPPERLKILLSCRDLQWESFMRNDLLPLYVKAGGAGRRAVRRGYEVFTIGDFTSEELDAALEAIDDKKLLVLTRDGNHADPHVLTLRDLLKHPATFEHYADLRLRGDVRVESLTWSQLIGSRLEVSLLDAERQCRRAESELRKDLIVLAEIGRAQSARDYSVEVESVKARLTGLFISHAGLDPLTNTERLFSKFDYGYDRATVNNVTYLQQQGLPVQHDNAGFGPGFVEGRGNLTSVRRWDATSPNIASLSVESTTGYNTDGSVIFKRDPEGHQTTISYADNFWSPASLPGEINRNTFAYPTTVTDPDGFSATSEYVYGMGSVREFRTPLPNVAVNKPGPIRRNYFDGAGRLVKVLTVDSGSYTRWEYADKMDVVKSYALVEAGKESYSARVLDGMGRTRASASNLPYSDGGYSGQLFDYDAMGRLARQSNPTATTAAGLWPATDEDAVNPWLYTETAYDWKGRPRLIINPGTPTTTKEFFYSGCGCAGGEVVTTRDEVGRRQRTTYDVLGRVSKTQVLYPQPAKPQPFVDDPEDNSPTTVYSTTTNSYDALDHVTRVVRQAASSGASQTTTAEYDGHGRVSSRKEPQAELATTYSYYLDDNLRTVTDGRGDVATYEYNGRRQRRVLKYDAPAGAEPGGDVEITYDYDAAGNRLRMADKLGHVNYEYDSASRLTAERRFFTDLNRTYRIAYEYNKAGQLSKITDPFDDSFEYKRDTAGRLTDVIGSPYGVTDSYVTDVRYRAWGGVKSASYGNNSSSTTEYTQRLQPRKFRLTDKTHGTGLMREDYSYHADGRISLVTDLNDTGGVNPPATLRFLTRSYSYDLAGRVTDSRGAGGGGQSLPYKQAYGYDEFDHLTHRSGSYYNYGGSPEQTYTANYTNNRRDGWGYDKDGRFTSSPATANSNARQVFYNAAGQQVKTVETRPNGGGAVTHTASSDGDGRVNQETSLDSANPGEFAVSYTVRSTALGGEPMTTLTAAGGKSMTYVPAGGLVFPRQVDAGGTVGKTVAFTQRDPVGVTDVHKLVYDPLGNPIPFQQATDPRPPAGSYNSSSMSGLAASVSNPNSYGLGCRLEGLPADCDRVLGMLNHGSARVDPLHRGGQNLPPAAPVFPVNNGGGEVVDVSYYYLGNLAPGGQPGTVVNPLDTSPTQGTTEADPCAHFIPKNVPPGVNIDDDIKTAEKEVAKLRAEAQKEADAIRRTGDLGARAAAGAAALSADTPGGPIDKWFYSMVADQKPWDYKYRDREGAARGDSVYEEYGNFTYGATGRASGYSLNVLQHMAGWYQTFEPEGTKSSSQYLARLGIGGEYPYGDQLKDAQQIEAGFAYYECRKAHPKQR